MHFSELEPYLKLQFSALEYEYLLEKNFKQNILIK